MTGKALFIELTDVGDDLVEEAEYGTFHDQAGQDASRKSRPFPQAKKWLVAAVIAAFLLLLAGFTFYLYRLEHLAISRNTANADPSMLVAGNVLSMQGYEGSPTYLALSEWLEYQTAYRMANTDRTLGGDFHSPEAYTPYACYTQEMVTKLDEICAKYQLRLLGKSVFLKDQTELEAAGAVSVLSADALPRCQYGHYYKTGTFVASGELEIPDGWERCVQFQMHSVLKEDFYPIALGVNDLNDFNQWNYETKDGFQALLALKEQDGLIFVETGERFISIIIGEVPSEEKGFQGLPQEKAFLERVCDSFQFTNHKGIG